MNLQQKKQQLEQLFGNLNHLEKVFSEELSNPAGGLEISGTSITDIPALVTDVKKRMATLFDRVQEENGQLAEELFHCYNQMNIAFEATIAVAQCKHLDHAIEVLLDEIARAVDGQYGFYHGHLLRHILAQQEETKQEPSSEEIITWGNSEETLNQAQEFWDRCQTELTALSEGLKEVESVMIGREGPIPAQYEGRGNVLVCRLQRDGLDQMGDLIFVRDQKQEPFEAVELGMAGILLRMGSAVLGNILYVHKLNRVYLQTITSLVRAMEAKDQYTSGHSNRVAQLACELGEYIGLPQDKIELLNWAGQLHDIGKIGIRDEVLHKTGKLTEEEFNHIKTHPICSFKVLEPLEALGSILAAVRHHHEHYDGGGYPDGLAGETIPRLARILQIADVWDALTSTRSYRKALTDEQAKEILRKEAGTTMDPLLVEEFMKLLEQKTL